MGTNYFAWHGFTEVLLGDRWVKASPTFNSTLCVRFGVAPLDFDGGPMRCCRPMTERGAPSCATR